MRPFEKNEIRGDLEPHVFTDKYHDRKSMQEHFASAMKMGLEIEAVLLCLTCIFLLTPLDVGITRNRPGWPENKQNSTNGFRSDWQVPNHEISIQDVDADKSFH